MDPARAEQMLGQVFRRLIQYAKDRRSNVVSIFRSKDRNSSGALSPEEFGVVLQEMLGEEYNETKLRIVMSHFDVDKNGVINYREFLSAIQEWQRVSRQHHGSGQRVHDPSYLARMYTAAPGSVYTRPPAISLRDLTLGVKPEKRTAAERRVLARPATVKSGSSSRKSLKAVEPQRNRPSTAYHGPPRFVSVGGTTFHAPTVAALQSAPTSPPEWQPGYVESKQTCPGGRHASLSKATHQRLRARPRRTHPTKLVWRTLSGGYTHAPKSLAGNPLKHVPCGGLFS